MEIGSELIINCQQLIWSGNKPGAVDKVERERQLVTENSDIFTCQPNDNLNLDADAFKSTEVGSVENSDPDETNLICTVSAVSGQIKGKLARVEVFNNDGADVANALGTLNVKIFVRLAEPLTLKSSEQIILQCSFGNLV